MESPLMVSRREFIVWIQYAFDGDIAQKCARKIPANKKTLTLDERKDVILKVFQKIKLAESTRLRKMERLAAKNKANHTFHDADHHRASHHFSRLAAKGRSS